MRTIKHANTLDFLLLKTPVGFGPKTTHLLKLKRSLSKTRTGPVLLRMVSGCPASRQNTAPVRAVPTKLSSTPCNTEIKRTCRQLTQARPLGTRTAPMLGHFKQDWAQFLTRTWGMFCIFHSSGFLCKLQTKEAEQAIEQSEKMYL